MEGKRFAVSIKTPSGAPPEYSRHALEAGRRKAGNELYNILWGYKLPAMVDIEEISRYQPANSMPDYRFFGENELIIEITVTPVQHHHVVMPAYDWSAQQYVQPTASGVGMRARFGNWLARLGNRIARIGGG